MNAPNPLDQPWARLHVVRGAPLQQFRFRARDPSELTIGSAPAAQLRLAAPGVAPRQLELAWDGAALWLQDPLRLGRTLVNGRPLNEWQLVRGEALIAFGEVRLWAASRLVLEAPAAPDFAALERARQGQSRVGACRRSPTMRLSGDEDAAELERLFSGAAGS